MIVLRVTLAGPRVLRELAFTLVALYAPSPLEPGS